MSLREIRVPLPFSSDEYRRGAWHACITIAKEKIDDGKPAVILDTYPVTDPVRGVGVFAHKVYFPGNEIPRFIQALLPRTALALYEKSWNYGNYSETFLYNEFIGDRFEIRIKSIYVEHDNGDTDNVFGLNAKDLNDRQILFMDITKPSSEHPKHDPSKYKSSKSGRGPLTKEFAWRKVISEPRVCVYKLIRTKFAVFGLQTLGINYMEQKQIDLILLHARRLFCTTDEWWGLDEAALRKMEQETFNYIKEKMKTLESIPPEISSGGSSMVSLSPSVSAFSSQSELVTSNALSMGSRTP